MPKNGKQNKTILILLFGLIFIVNKIALAHVLNLTQPSYDYIDVANQTANGRNKGQTTRIFTDDDELDEKFWLKYLGEEFRDAVHLQVDSNNNVVPMDSDKPQEKDFIDTNNIDSTEEKRTRFSRESIKENKQIPVDQSLNKEDTKTLPEKKENHNDTPIIIPQVNTKPKHLHFNPTPNKEEDKPSKNPPKKVLIHNKYKQKIIKVGPSSPLKAIHEPIVVNLPETTDAEHQINKELQPLIVKTPAVIYHQKLHFPQGQSSITDQKQPYHIPIALHNTAQIPNTLLHKQDQNKQKYLTHSTPQLHINTPQSLQQTLYIPNQYQDYTIFNPKQDNNVYPTLPQDYSSYQNLPLSPLSLLQLPLASFPRSS